MRPAWEKFLTYRLAMRLGSTPKSYRMAAFAVRELDLRYGLNAAMQGVSVTSATDLDDADVVPQKFVSALERFWKKVRATEQPRVSENSVRDAIERFAYAAYLTLPVSEIGTAKALAKEAMGVGFPSESDNGGWSGLREEIVALAPYTANDWQQLSTSSSARIAAVKQFQSWARGKGFYNKAIDGVWGTGSEGAFLSVVPEAEKNLTTTDYFRKLVNAMPSSTAASVVIGTVIARDLWLLQDPSRVAVASASFSPPLDVEPPPPSSSAVGKESTVVVTVKEDAPSADRLPGVQDENGSQVSVQMVEDRAASGKGWMWAVGAGVLVVGAALLWRKSNG